MAMVAEEKYYLGEQSRLMSEDVGFRRF